MSPREVDRLTLAEFSAMFDGFAASKGGKSDEPTDDDHAEYAAAYAAFHAQGMT